MIEERAYSGIYIDNSYQTPNFYADDLDYFLLPIETKVLWKILREIIGYHENLADRQNAVSLPTIVEGKIGQRGKNKGKRLSKGCGLSRQTVQKALQSLCQYQILLRVRKTSVGVIYEVNFDTDSIDWEGLQRRKLETEAKQRQRIEKARDTHAKNYAQETI